LGYLAHFSVKTKPVHQPKEICHFFMEKMNHAHPSNEIEGSNAHDMA
jgi:hypothetical protein